MYSVLVRSMKSPTDRAHCSTVVRKICALVTLSVSKAMSSAKSRSVRWMSSWSSSLDGEADAFSHFVGCISHDVVITKRYGANVAPLSTPAVMSTSSLGPSGVMMCAVRHMTSLTILGVMP